MNNNELCALARAACERAYAPYSGCCVGAAVLASSGKVYVGCNIENASFSATVCAERTALFSAVAAGEREFSALAVAAVRDGKSAVFPPCGICRQTLSEFCAADMPVLICDGDGFREHTLGGLLPHSFSLR